MLNVKSGLNSKCLSKKLNIILLNIHHAPLCTLQSNDLKPHHKSEFSNPDICHICHIAQTFGISNYDFCYIKKIPKFEISQVYTIRLLRFSVGRLCEFVVTVQLIFQCLMFRAKNKSSSPGKLARPDLLLTDNRDMVSCVVHLCHFLVIVGWYP